MSLTAEQIAVRKTRVGASEIGALVDFYSPSSDGQRVDPYKTALRVFADKDLPAENDDPEDHQQWGLDIEPAILTNHARRFGIKLAPAPGTLVHPSLPLCATPDGIGTRNGRFIDIQAKNAQRFQSHRWGEPGTDDAPLLYVAQVTVELGILKETPEYRELIEDTGDLAVCIEGGPPKAYHIRFDPEMFGALAELAAKFKRDHLDTRKPPVIDGSDAAADYVKRRWARHTGEMQPWTPDAQALADIARTHGETEKISKTLKDEARNQLKMLIGEAAGIEGLCTWKLCKDSVKTLVDWEAVSRELAVIAMKGNEASAAGMLEQLARKHLRAVITKKGVRKFLLLKATGESEEEIAA